jgi:dynein heavy chain
MPRKEKYGAQPPIELLRQMIDNGGWYDNKEKHKPYKKIVEYIFLGAMQPPGRGQNEITPRMQRHMNMVSFTSLDNENMVRIFFHIINWFFNTRSFSDDIKKLGSKIVNGTLECYKAVVMDFKPTPSKSHYSFNLRDFARVINGICLSHPQKVTTPEIMTKLWVHEIWRVFRYNFSF